MKFVEFIHSVKFKVLFPIIIVWGAMTIFKSGVAFGHWMYAFIH